MIRVDIGRVVQFPDMVDRPLMSAVDPADERRRLIQPYADRPEPMQFALERLARAVARKRNDQTETATYKRRMLDLLWAEV